MVQMESMMKLFRILCGLVKLAGIILLLIFCLPARCIYSLIERKGKQWVCLWTFATEGDVRFILAALTWAIPAFLIMMAMGAHGYRFE